MVVGQFEHSPTVSVGKSGCRNFKLSHHQFDDSTAPPPVRSQANKLEVTWADQL